MTDEEFKQIVVELILVGRLWAGGKCPAGITDGEPHSETRAPYVFRSKVFHPLLFTACKNHVEYYLKNNFPQVCSQDLDESI